MPAQSATSRRSSRRIRTSAASARAPLGLVRDHSDELRAVVRRQPPDDLEHRVETLGELGLGARAEVLGAALSADGTVLRSLPAIRRRIDPVADAPGTVGRRAAAVTRPRRAGRHRTRSVRARDDRPTARLVRRAASSHGHGQDHRRALTLQNGRDYTPPRRGRPCPAVGSRIRGQHTPRGRRSQSHRRRTRR